MRGGIRGVDQLRLFRLVNYKLIVLLGELSNGNSVNKRKETFHFELCCTYCDISKNGKCCTYLEMEEVVYHYYTNSTDSKDIHQVRLGLCSLHFIARTYYFFLLESDHIRPVYPHLLITTYV